MTDIKLDYDYRKRPDLEKVTYLLHFFSFHPTVIRITRSVHFGWHVSIRLRESLSPSETVATQLLFGSDSKREMYNLARVLKLKQAPRYWKSKWNILYEAD